MTKIERLLVAAAVWARGMAELRTASRAQGVLVTMMTGMTPEEGAVAPGETRGATGKARRRQLCASYVAGVSKQKDRCSLQDKDGLTQHAQQDFAYWLGMIGIVAPRTAWCLPACEPTNSKEREKLEPFCP
jgi:hypothetical protein